MGWSLFLQFIVCMLHSFAVNKTYIKKVTVEPITYNSTFSVSRAPIRHNLKWEPIKIICALNISTVLTVPTFQYTLLSMVLQVQGCCIQNSYWQKLLYCLVNILSQFHIGRSPKGLYFAMIYGIFCNFLATRVLSFDALFSIWKLWNSKKNVHTCLPWKSIF